MLESLVNPEIFPSAFAVLATLYVCLKLAARHLKLPAPRLALGVSRSTAEHGDDLAQLMHLAENGPSREVRVAAVHSLGERRSTAAIPLLGRLLSAGDSLLASEAANSLGAIGDPSALSYLEAATTALERELSRSMDNTSAGGSAGAGRDRAASPQAPWERILPALAKSNFRVFDKYTPHDLRSQSEKRVIEMILEIAASTDEPVSVRYHAIKNLEMFRDRSIGQTLPALLSDPHSTVRYATAEVLAVHGDESCVDALVSTLEDPNRFVRSSAAMTLAVLGSDRAIAPLKKLQEDDDDVVRYSAGKALESIGRKKKIGTLFTRREAKGRRP